MSFYIKNIEIKERVILAPMAGITSFSYRKFMNPFGCGLTVTEMISDCGLVYKNKRTEEMLYTDGSDRPLSVQLFGGETETLLQAIDRLDELGVKYDLLDLNLACPVPKVTKNNGGSKWLLDLNRLEEMVTKIGNRSKKPVTAKIRLGWNKINVYEVCKLLEKCGVSFISIHARTKEELYSGKPHFEEISDLKNVIKIPFGVSGNIFSVEDALTALNITKADAILVARGGIGNPELITNINKAINGEEYNDTLDFNRQVTYLKTFTELLIKEKGKTRAMSILRGLAPKFLLKLDIEGIKELRNKITTKSKTIDDLFNYIDEFKKGNHL